MSKENVLLRFFTTASEIMAEVFAARLDQRCLKNERACHFLQPFFGVGWATSGVIWEVLTSVTFFGGNICDQYRRLHNHHWNNSQQGNSSREIGTSKNMNVAKPYTGVTF